MAWGDLSTGQKIAGGTLAGGGLAGGLYNMFNKSKNPAGSAVDELDRIPETLSPYYQPYIDQGMRQSPDLENQYNEMSNDPSSIISRLGAGYKSSPGYDWRMGQGQNAINNAAAAGGMLGSGQHQQRAGEMAENIAGQDYDQYLQHVLSLFSSGIQGKQGLQTQGYGASTGLADALAQVLGSKAQYKYAGQAGENANKSSGIGDLFSGIGSIAGMFL